MNRIAQTIGLVIIPGALWTLLASSAVLLAQQPQTQAPSSVDKTLQQDLTVLNDIAVNRSVQGPDELKFVGKFIIDMNAWIREQQEAVAADHKKYQEQFTAMQNRVTTAEAKLAAAKCTSTLHSSDHALGVYRDTKPPVSK
jgi:hypothetical protein